MSIYAAASGMVLEQKRQEIIARNLASSEIAGYKREFISSHNFKADLSREVMENTNKYQGTSGGEIHIDLQQGAIKKTNDPLDFAINGPGYFETESQDGHTMYTRNGQFSLDRDGILITKNGDAVQGIDGEIQVPLDASTNNLRISPNGEITIDTNVDGEQEITALGTLKIMTTDDSSILKKISSSDFIVEDVKNQEQMVEVDTSSSRFMLSNGYLESSNASPIKDMVLMVQSMREFEMGQKMLKSLDDMGKQARAKLG